MNSDIDKLDEIIQELLTQHRRGAICRDEGMKESAIHHAQNSLQDYIKERELEAFEFGYSFALDGLHNETLYYLADTRRKTVDWEWLKKRMPRQEFGDTQAEFLKSISRTQELQSLRDKVE